MKHVGSRAAAILIAILAASSACYTLGYIAKRRLNGGYLSAKDPSMVWSSAEPSHSFMAHRAICQFEVFNKGGGPVRILSADSGCGCARPVVEPMIILPGRSGLVKVDATPPTVGERTVDIYLRTDSPLTPKLVLKLKMTTDRSPPFLLEAKGDLTYVDFGSGPVSRELTVITAERRFEVSRVDPSRWISSDLDFLAFIPTGITERSFRDKENSFARVYTYNVLLTRLPPLGVFTGEVRVRDPWHPSVVKTLNVYGRRSEDVAVVPRTVTMGRSLHASDSRGSRVLFVFPEDPGDFEVVPEPEGIGRISFSSLCPPEAPRGRGPRTASYSVTVKEDASSGGGGKIYRCFLRRKQGKILAEFYVNLQ